VLPEPVRRFWSAALELSPNAERCDWGYVETDARFPDVWDANNATVLTPRTDLTLDEVLDELRPCLRAAGARSEHIEFWEPGVDSPALREARSIGMKDRIDVVMTFEGGSSSPPAAVEVEELREPPEDFWPWYRAGLNEFETAVVLAEEVLDQLVARTRDVFVPAGTRFFVARVDGERAGYASLLRLEGVGYLDSVVTMPEYRRRGVASSTVMAAVEASRSAGAEVTFLLADDGGEPSRLYERLGFRVASRIETLNRPLAEG
jgi:ribosomal protein S18 acetylase RimI-like enzyme